MNIKGDDFFELHVKFEELYNDLQIKVDEVAECILTLGYIPDHRYSTYIDESEIKESKRVTDGNKAVVHEIFDAFIITIKLQRAILELSDEVRTL